MVNASGHIKYNEASEPSFLVNTMLCILSAIYSLVKLGRPSQDQPYLFFRDIVPNNTTSMFPPQEVAGKRKGVCSVRMEPLDMTLPRGREFTHIVEQALIKEEKENRM